MITNTKSILITLWYNLLRARRLSECDELKHCMQIKFHVSLRTLTIVASGNLMCVSLISAEKTTLPQPPLNSCSQEAEHIYDTIPANTPHFYGVLEGPTLESDYHGLEDDSEGDEDARDKLQNCQDIFEVREKLNLLFGLSVGF